MRTQPRLSLLSILTLTAALSAALLSACDGDNANAANAPLPRADGAPVIGGQPYSLLVKDGEPAMFAVTSVMGGATLPVRFQWQRNGVDIPGADKPYLILGRTSLQDDGARYTVVARNAAGSATSRPGVLAVVGTETELPWR
jgi:hypothetical protein